MILPALLALCGCASGLAPAPRAALLHGDAPLSALIAKGLAQSSAPAAAPTVGRGSRPAEIARAYVTLRAQQSALVLLARHEELDTQLVLIARQCCADGMAAPERVAAAQAQLEGTQAEQRRMRAGVAAQRDRLAALAGSAPGTLDRIPGGPIPLPPAQQVVDDPAAMVAGRPDIRRARHQLAIAWWGAQRRRAAAYRVMVLAARQDVETAMARYRAAQEAAGRAQAQAAQASVNAALDGMQARAGTLAPAAAIEADCQALDALQAEQQARAAMTQAYIVLVQVLGLDWQVAPPR